MSERDQLEGWVIAAQSGDEFALAKLLAAYHPRLLAYTATRLDAAMKVRVAPADVLQEVYWDVARRIDRFENRGPGSFLAWVHGILNQKIAGAQRAAHRQARDVGREVPVGVIAGESHWDLLDQVYADSATPSRAVRRREAVDALMTSLSSLPEVQRRVIQLRFLEQLNVAEVADRLGKSEAAIVALSHRALAALRGAMDRTGQSGGGMSQ